MEILEAQPPQLGKLVGAALTEVEVEPLVIAGQVGPVQVPLLMGKQAPAVEAEAEVAEISLIHILETQIYFYVTRAAVAAALASLELGQMERAEHLIPEEAGAAAGVLAAHRAVRPLVAHMVAGAGAGSLLRT